MSCKSEIAELLDNPRLRARFAREPAFPEVMGALSEFGKPLIFMRSGRTVCAVTVADPDGPRCLAAVSEHRADPAGAALRCLTGLLERADGEAAKGIAEIEAFLSVC